MSECEPVSTPTREEIIESLRLTYALIANLTMAERVLSGLYSIDGWGKATDVMKRLVVSGELGEVPKERL